MKSQLPVLIMLLSEFGKTPKGLRGSPDAVPGSIQPGKPAPPVSLAHRLSAAYPLSRSHGAGRLTRYITGRATSARSKKKRFG
jgi:hypothetical protein